MRTAPAGLVGSVVGVSGSLVSFSPELWTVSLVADSPVQIAAGTTPTAAGCSKLQSAMQIPSAV